MSETGRKASNALVAVVDFYASERAGQDVKIVEQGEIIRLQAAGNADLLRSRAEAERERDVALVRAATAERSIFELAEKLRVAETASGRAREAADAEVLLFRGLVAHGLISKDATFGVLTLARHALDGLARLDTEAGELYALLKKHKIRAVRKPLRLPRVKAAKG